MGIKGARVYSNTLKQEIVRRLEAGERAAAIADEAGIDPKLLYDWRALYRRMGIAGLSRQSGRRRVWNGRPPSAGLTLSEPSPLTDGGPSAARPADQLAEAQARIAELERLIGRQQVDLHFFREALRIWDATSPNDVAPASTRSSKTMIAEEPQGFAQDDANVRRLCALAGVSRAGYYRHLGPHPAAREDADLRDLIHRVALEDRHYGYRRVTHELLRQGVVVNHKRVARLMREDNLLACAPNRSFRRPR